MNDHPTEGPALPRDARRLLWRRCSLTRSGMVAERALRAFWPLATVVLAVLAALMFGLHEVLPLEGFWALSVLSCGLLSGRSGAASAGSAGRRRPRRWRGWTPPCPAGRSRRSPTARRSAPATRPRTRSGRRIWRGWRRGCATPARSNPICSLAAPRPLCLALRGAGGVRDGADVRLVLARRHGRRHGARRSGAAAAETAAWEGWVEPPAYTGKPSLYLADIPPARSRCRQGSQLTLRLYGEVGQLIVDETVSGRTGVVSGASEPAQSFDIAPGRQAGDPRPRRQRMADRGDRRRAAGDPGRWRRHPHRRRRDAAGFHGQRRLRRDPCHGADRAGSGRVSTAATGWPPTPSRASRSRSTCRCP